MCSRIELIMHLKLLARALMLLLLFASIASLSACSVGGTKMEFSFNTSVSSNSIDEKTIYINNDIDKLELDAELKVDSGHVTIEVIRISDDEVVWSNSFQKDSSFVIELNNAKAGSEYFLKIETAQSKKVSLVITSDNKLVKNKDNPPKFIVEAK